MPTILIKAIAASVTFGIAFASPSASVPEAIPLPAGSAVISAGTTAALTPLDKWVNKLVYEESRGRSDLKILDHNGYYSYGCLQFQMPTFKAYVHRYDLLPESEDSELENMIYDCNFQKKLTKLMIQEDPGNWRHWYTSVADKGLGLPPTEKELAKR